MEKLENEINLEDQNSQKATENIISKVIQKLKEPKIIILVVLLVILSLGSIFAGINYQQKQILIDQEKKTVESQKSDSVLDTTKESPFLEILDTKNQIPTGVKEELATAKTYDCQPDFFDPETSKYREADAGEQVPRRDGLTTYVIDTKDSYKYYFVVISNTAKNYTMAHYSFICGGSGSSEILEIKSQGKRVALYTHISSFYFNENKTLLFMDNSVKNSDDKWILKRRIISLDGTKKTDIGAADCGSQWMRWNGDDLITYSDANTDRSGLQGDAYSNYKTKICLWDTNGSLKYKLQGKLTWYGASSDTLWAEVGTLPKDPNIFYAYDNNRNSTPQMCSLFLQDLTDQKRNKTIDLFLEGSDDMPQHLCPWNPSLKFDFSQTTFDSSILKFKLDPAIYGNNKYYKKYTNWQGLSNPPLQSLILYKDDNISFKYPAYLIMGQKTIGGSHYSQEFKEENGQYTLTFSAKGNYNQITGKPYATIDEYINMPYKVKTVIIDGQEGRQPLPRAGSENNFSASFFSKDLKWIYTLDLEVPKDEIKIDQGQKMLDQVISTIKFSDIR